MFQTRDPPQSSAALVYPACFQDPVILKMACRPEQTSNYSISILDNGNVQSLEVFANMP